MTKISNESGYIEFYRRKRGSVELYDIQIDEKFRRKGAGTELLKKMEAHIGNGKTIYLFTRVENLIAKQFYIKNGFQIITQLNNFYPERWDDKFSGNALMMVKWL